MTKNRISYGLVALPLLVLAMSLQANIAESAAPALSKPSSATLAERIDVTKADLAPETIWVSTKPTNQTAGNLTAGRTVLSCIESAGGVDSKISADAFSTYGRATGQVTTDVASLNYSPKGATGNVPQVSSEVVFLKSTAQTAIDLKAFATKPSLDCYGQELAALVSAGSNQAAVNSSVGTRTRFGSGNGGIHDHFAVTGGQLSSTLYDDVYFYVVGHAEILVTFLNLGLPYGQSAQQAVVAKVLKRATSLLH